MSRTFAAALLVAAAACLYQAAARANGSTVPPSPSASPLPARDMTPEDLAVHAYNTGLDRRDRGMKAEQKALAARKDSDRLKEQKKAREEYERALKEFRKAADYNPKLPQAWNGMGFATRKLGDYQKALDYYDRALQLAPNFPDAIEYRAEAYLALNRIDDAKQAYLALFAMDRKQADQLMEAMKDWVAQRRGDPAGVDPAALSAFETWLEERAGVARETRLMALDQRHMTWR
ncbi:MAG TPA: tetratricopeptide repeat protein [Vicinamibacterales bacterium]|nr:tetratricopeptide repeat protein [Vicinamibacterales bacterium]